MLKIEELIIKYNSGQCSADEKKLVELWYQSFEWNDERNLFNENNIEHIKEEVWFAVQKNKITEASEKSTNNSPQIYPLLRWWHFASAAAVITAIAAISFLQFTPSKKIAVAKLIKPNQLDIKTLQPGTSKAQLMLADGSVISLDSSRSLHLQEADGTSIDKQSGKLVYKDDNGGNRKILFNTLSTPRGGEFQLELPDGSKVWLNATSSIKFPTRFEGKDRTVFLHGEAYFEVAKNKQMPFYVKLDNDLAVEVTGTHFNIMGYNDESEIRTTLVEGSVKVTHENNTVFLSPSKQAIMKRGNETLLVSDADVDKALAWKKGMIEFEGNDLPYIMRQLSRWYNIDIDLKNDVSKGTYKGAIRRQAPLMDVLEILKLAGVKYKMEDKKLIVTGG